MAELLVGYGDSRTPIQHSNDIFKEHLRNFPLAKLIGKRNSGMPIIVDDTLKGKAGDTIVFHFIAQNKTDGIYGQNATITGNEESLEEYLDTIKIDQVAKAFKKMGKLTDKRIVWNWRSEAKDQLAKWYADRNCVWCFDALTGYLTNGFDYIPAATRATTALVNGVGRCVRADASDGVVKVAAADSTDTALSTAMSSVDKISTDLLDELSIVAKQGNPKYRVAPFKMASNGKEMFVLVVSLQAGRDLRHDAVFKSHALSLVQAGISPDKDPFASGSLGIWNNLIIMESEYIRTVSKTASGATNTFARNLMLGANAMAMVWAQTTDYVEKPLDYNRGMGVNADEIRGQKKLVFDGVDQGVIQVITASN